MLSTFPNLGLTWDDLDWLREQTSCRCSSRACSPPRTRGSRVERGVDGIIVSNHGGRQVDGAVASLDALVEVREAVGDGVPLLVDGGIRTGADVAQGARARRRRGAARPAVRVRPRGRRAGGRRRGDPPADGRDRPDARARRRRARRASSTGRGSRADPRRAGRAAPRGDRGRRAGRRARCASACCERRLPQRPARGRDTASRRATRCCSATRAPARSTRSARASRHVASASASCSAGARPAARAPACARGEPRRCERARGGAGGGCAAGRDAGRSSSCSAPSPTGRSSTPTQAIPVPRELPAEQACLIGCAVATGVGSVLNTAQVWAGARVAVIGCGGVGLSVVQGARIAGAAGVHAVDLDERKLEQALTLRRDDTRARRSTASTTSSSTSSAPPATFARRVDGARATTAPPCSSACPAAARSRPSLQHLFGRRLAHPRLARRRPPAGRGLPAARRLRARRPARPRRDGHEARSALDDVEAAFDDMRRGDVIRSVVRCEVPRPLPGDDPRRGRAAAGLAADRLPHDRGGRGAGRDGDGDRATRHTSPPGSAHGGILVDIADAAMGCAYGTLLADGRRLDDRRAEGQLPAARVAGDAAPRRRPRRQRGPDARADRVRRHERGGQAARPCLVYGDAAHGSA